MEEAEMDSLVQQNNNADGKNADFVLVWEDNPSDPQWSIHTKRREIFISNLVQEGLLVEEGESTGKKDLRFAKIYASHEVLQRYAEILKIRLPIKQFSADMLHSESAEGEDMLEFKLSQLDNNGEYHESEIRIPLVSDVQDGINSWIRRLQAPLLPDENMFPRRKCQFTAVYSRDKDYLFDHSDPNLYSPATRSKIVEFLLKRKRFSADPDDDFAFGVDKLITEESLLACYPLHDGGLETGGSQRNLLYTQWASLTKFWKYQPLDAIRDYYGVKMGLYFAWLGFYTSMLIPPSLVGIACFIYALSTYSSDIPTNEICNGPMSNVTMCPICDEFCEFWPLESACMMTRAKYFFDNGTTVMFALFMSFWSVIFTEMWRRYSAEITHRWDVFGYDPEEEHPRPEFLSQLKNVKERKINFVTQCAEPKPPFFKMKLPGVLMSWTSVLMFIILALITVIAIILYRMAMIVALSTCDDDEIKKNYSIFIAATGASINLVLIMVFNYIYELLAICLTEKELHRTQTGFDDALTLKIYLFQFVNYYASIFYIAFFKGQFVGTPNKYVRFLGWRQEECAPGGCFVELSIQLAIVFMGKQFMLSIMEYYIPLLWRGVNWVRLNGWRIKEKGDVFPQYVQDFKLLEWNNQSLFYEYLEMVIQYGFITIFVCAFPLAPFFALLNNILELRLDAKKVLVHYRRPTAQKVQGIGVWLDIIETLGRISIISNAFIIALTSEIIPKMVYRGFYSEDGSLHGYVNFSLSYMDMAHYDPASNLHPTLKNISDNVICRYADYKSPADDVNPYNHNSTFWHIWLARLLFVVVFENTLSLFLMFLKFLIPDVPSSLKYKIRREEYITKEIIIRTERLKTSVRIRSGTLSDSRPPLTRQSSLPLRRGMDDVTVRSQETPD